MFKPSESAGLFGSPPITVYNSKFDGFTLSAKFYETDNGQIPKQVQFKLDYLNSTGTYDLGVYPIAIFKHSYAYGPVYRTNSTYTGQVKITRCDTINKIYSGTFYFNALDENTRKVVNVTDGRFDVKGK